jgi:hypothetical protein
MQHTTNAGEAGHVARLFTARQMVCVVRYFDPGRYLTTPELRSRSRREVVNRARRHKPALRVALVV